MTMAVFFIWRRPAVAAQFLSRVDRRGPDECWPWLGSLCGSGYGEFSHAGTKATTHRLAFALDRCRDPGASLVLHACDNRPCCNPGHLYEGDDLQNARDREARQRSRGQLQRGHSKLRPRDVYAIWRSIRFGLNNTEIAARFGVTHSNVSAIRRGKSWARLTCRLGAAKE